MRKLSLIFLSLLLTGYALERLVPYIGKSDSFSDTQESKRWFKKYWKPINTLGYRDTEYSVKEHEGRRLLVIVGDSFAAGHGIQKIDQRFSDLLEQKLGAGWVVANVAQCGWDTSHEFEALKKYPHKPHTVVLSYFINDIDSACQSEGLRPSSVVHPPTGWMRTWMEKSDLVDFIYWRWFRMRYGKDLSLQYAAYLRTCYSDSRVWTRHSHQLKDFIQYTRTKGIQLRVILFPALIDVASSGRYTARVSEVFKKAGIPALDMAPILAGRKPSELYVNPFDTHPNPALHREVAELVLPLLQ